MLDVYRFMNHFFEQGRIYLSEIDFQLSLAWKIKEMYDDIDLRLEQPMIMEENGTKRNNYIDIALRQDGAMVPIELKYTTKKLEFEEEGQTIVLKNHGAQDVRRYDFVKDIERVERVLRENERVAEGYCIFLTNDASYLKSPGSFRGKPVVDNQFRIHEGAILKGTLKWEDWTSSGTKRGREKELSLQGEYHIKWNKIENGKLDGFFYSIVEITNQP